MKSLFGVTNMLSTYVYSLLEKQSRITLSLFLKLCGENKFAETVKVLTLNIKSINPMKKFPQIIESSACIVKIFVIILLLLTNILIFSGLCSTPKLFVYHPVTIDMNYVFLHLQLRQLLLILMVLTHFWPTV